MTARIPHTSQPSCHLLNSSPSISRWTWVASNWETFTEWRPSFTFTKARLMSSTFSKAFAAVATPSMTVSIYDRKQDGLAIFFFLLVSWSFSRSFKLLTLQAGKSQISGAMRTHTLGAGQFVQFILTLVCYTAVFRVVTQGALRDDTKNGCVADYLSPWNE